jgi:hypothetical protein
MEETKSCYSGDLSFWSGKCSPVFKKISPRIKLYSMLAERAREMALAAAAAAAEAQNEQVPKDDADDRPLMQRVSFKFD